MAIGLLDYFRMKAYGMVDDFTISEVVHYVWPNFCLTFNGIISAYFWYWISTVALFWLYAYPDLIIMNWVGLKFTKKISPGNSTLSSNRSGAEMVMCMGHGSWTHCPIWVKSDAGIGGWPREKVLSGKPTTLPLNPTLWCVRVLWEMITRLVAQVSSFGMVKDKVMGR